MSGRYTAPVGWVPTYALTDNEKTVTVDHVAGVPVRHPMIVSAGRHYGIQVHTCVPFDPESKGWLGGDGADRQGRPGPHVREPVHRLWFGNLTEGQPISPAGVPRPPWYHGLWTMDRCTDAARHEPELTQHRTAGVLAVVTLATMINV
jgi:hypothetical protein